MAASLVSMILKRAEESPAKPAFVFLGTNSRRTVLTFGDVSDLSQKFAAVLRDNGFGDGDVVCNTLANSPERLITQLGTIMAGAVVLNGQVCLADGSDFLKSLKDGRVSAILYNPNDSEGPFHKILKDRIKLSRDKRKIVCADVPCLEMLIPCVLEAMKGTDVSLVEKLMNENRRFCIDKGPNSLVSYLCTSGSTGVFKIVPASSEFLLESGQEMGPLLGINKDSVVMNNRPLGYLAGTPALVFATGCTRVTIEDTVPRDSGYLQLFIEALRREKCTSAIVVTTLLNTLLEGELLYTNGNGWLLRSLAVLGAPMMKKYLRSIGLLSESLVMLYGSTEIAVMTAMTLTSRSEEYEDFLCGEPIERTEIKIVDSNMVDVPVGQIGDIVAKKAVCCTHYVNSEKHTQKTFLPGGWLRLGDRGFLNSKGQLSVLGRGAHALLSGDDKVYPELLEASILRCPGLAEVTITGVPDPVEIEEVCALLVRQPHAAGQEVDEAYVKRFCEDSFIVTPDGPEFIPMPKYFLFVDSIPKLFTGKDDRVACKLLAAELVNNNRP